MNMKMETISGQESEIHSGFQTTRYLDSYKNILFLKLHFWRSANSQLHDAVQNLHKCKFLKFPLFFRQHEKRKKKFEFRIICDNQSSQWTVVIFSLLLFCFCLRFSFFNAVLPLKMFVMEGVQCPLFFILPSHLMEKQQHLNRFVLFIFWLFVCFISFLFMFNNVCFSVSVPSLLMIASSLLQAAYSLKVQMVLRQKLLVSSSTTVFRRIIPVALNYCQSNIWLTPTTSQSILTSSLDPLDQPPMTTPLNPLNQPTRISLFSRYVKGMGC